MYRMKSLLPHMFSYPIISRLFIGWISLVTIAFALDFLSGVL